MRRPDLVMTMYRIVLGATDAFAAANPAAEGALPLVATSVSVVATAGSEAR